MSATHPALNVIFQALADPTRRGVMERLGRGPATVSELAAPYGMALPSFVQHLRALETCGLVRSVKRGRVRTCYLQPETLAEAEDWLAAQRKNWTTRLDQLDTYLAEMADKETDDEH
jgi:DNA-binding transcriptional ArsR family regulator